MKTVRVQYFAALREQAGCREETVATTAATLTGLYQEEEFDERAMRRAV